MAAEPKWIPEMGLKAKWERRRGGGGREGRTLFTWLYVSGRVNSLRCSRLAAAEMRGGRGDADLG